jgi:predicted amidohydrolase
MNRYIAAAVQMHSGEDRAENLAVAEALVEESARQGAALVVLPEFFIQLGRIEAMVAAAEPVPGPTSRAMSALAARLGVTLLAGSICEQTETPDRAYNTSLLFGPDGRLMASYRKLHLFDVDLADMVTFQESQFILPGDEVALSVTPLGKLGQATCYDLRFPELFRQLSAEGMEVLLFPSAFAAPTGQAHWQILLRARAIENQCYVIASNQYGQHTPRLATYGHSMIVDPWGVVQAAAEEGEAVVLAEVDPKALAEIRRQLPALKHRRM